MILLRSMYSGVSGMKNFQIKLDTIGNNIANVNTVGFKKGRVMFQDLLSQNIAGASAPINGLQGGSNPRQVGLGSTVSSIDTIHTPGSAMTTGVLTDLSIEGEGFFLVLPAGADADDFGPGPAPGDGNPFLTRAGNFQIDAEGQMVTSTGLLVLDVNGDIIDLKDTGAIDLEDIESINISSTGVITVTEVDGNSTDVATIGIGNVTNPGGLRKVGGTLYEYTPNAQAGGQIQWADLTAGDLSSRIISGQLEMSNVDLTDEFTEMIVAQRGFQSNARIVTTSDEVLQELVNLKR